MRISDWSSDVCSSDLAPSPCRPVLSCRPSDPDQPEARRRGEQQPGELRAPPRHHQQREGEDAPEERQQEQGKSVAVGLRTAAEPRERARGERRSEEHTSDLKSLMRLSYAVFCLKKKKTLLNQ